MTTCLVGKPPKVARQLLCNRAAARHDAPMDEHQRRVWGRILERLDDYESGEVGLRKLLADLRGLLDAADLHDQRVINEFRSYFAPLEGEYELRTEPWAPDGLASDERLDEALRDLRGWALAVLRDTDDRRS